MFHGKIHYFYGQFQSQTVSHYYHHYRRVPEDFYRFLTVLILETTSSWLFLGEFHPTGMKLKMKHWTSGLDHGSERGNLQDLQGEYDVAKVKQNIHALVI